MLVDKSNEFPSFFKTFLTLCGLFTKWGEDQRAIGRITRMSEIPDKGTKVPFRGIGVSFVLMKVSLPATGTELTSCSNY